MPEIRAGLLVVDLQEDLCRDARRRHLVDAMLPTLRGTLDKCLNAGIPVVFSQYWLPKDDEQFQRFGDKYCIAHTPGADIVSELKSYVPAVSVVRKEKHSAFFDTNLDQILAEKGVKLLGIAGLQTHICVMTTAADASFRGYEPMVLSDCVVSSTATKKAAALDWIGTYFGSVGDSELFLGRAGIATS